MYLQNPPIVKEGICPKPHCLFQPNIVNILTSVTVSFSSDNPRNQSAETIPYSDSTDIIPNQTNIFYHE